MDSGLLASLGPGMTRCGVANAAPPCFFDLRARASPLVPLFLFPKGEWSAGKRLRACETPVGRILGVRVPAPGRSRAPRRDGIASSVPRRASGNPVRVRTGRKGREAPPGAPPRRQASAACGGNNGVVVGRRSPLDPAPRHDSGASPSRDGWDKSIWGGLLSRTKSEHSPGHLRRAEMRRCNACILEFRGRACCSPRRHLRNVVRRRRKNPYQSS